MFAISTWSTTRCIVNKSPYDRIGQNAVVSCRSKIHLFFFFNRRKTPRTAKSRYRRCGNSQATVRFRQERSDSFADCIIFFLSFIPRFSGYSTTRWVFKFASTGMRYRFGKSGNSISGDTFVPSGTLGVQRNRANSVRLRRARDCVRGRTLVDLGRYGLGAIVSALSGPSGFALGRRWRVQRGFDRSVSPDTDSVVSDKPVMQ